MTNIKPRNTAEASANARWVDIVLAGDTPIVHQAPLPDDRMELMEIPLTHDAYPRWLNTFTWMLILVLLPAVWALFIWWLL